MSGTAPSDGDAGTEDGEILPGVPEDAGDLLQRLFMPAPRQVPRRTLAEFGMELGKLIGRYEPVLPGGLLAVVTTVFPHPRSRARTPGIGVSLPPVPVQNRRTTFHTEYRKASANAIPEDAEWSEWQDFTKAGRRVLGSYSHGKPGQEPVSGPDPDAPADSGARYCRELDVPTGRMTYYVLVFANGKPVT